MAPRQSRALPWCPDAGEEGKGLHFVDRAQTGSTDLDFGPTAPAG
nr:hypothetical protein [Ensifer sp. IC4062]